MPKSIRYIENFSAARSADHDKAGVGPFDLLSGAGRFLLEQRKVSFFFFFLMRRLLFFFFLAINHFLFFGQVSLRSLLLPLLLCSATACVCGRWFEGVTLGPRKCSPVVEFDDRRAERRRGRRRIRTSMSNFPSTPLCRRICLFLFLLLFHRPSSLTPRALWSTGARRDV